MYAIIRDGGKEYRVETGQVVELEIKQANPGATVEFPEVLFYKDDQESLIGQPLLAQVKVKGVVEKLFRGKKLIAYRFRRRENMRRKRGHRQNIMAVRITEVSKA